MSKMLTFKFKITDNTGGAISISSIKISEYPTPGAGQPVSAIFTIQPTYVLATVSINNISGLPKMIKIEYTTSNGVTSILYDNVINDQNCVSTVVVGGNTIYTRKGLIMLSTDNGNHVASLCMVPPSYF